jgi:hypothetical protein
MKLEELLHTSNFKLVSVFKPQASNRLNKFLTQTPKCPKLESMWPFRRRPNGIRKTWENLVVGLIIGGAIGSIIGKKLMDEKNNHRGANRENEGEDNIRT